MFRVNSVLKSLLGTFTRTQNAPAESRRRNQMKCSRESKPIFFFEGGGGVFKKHLVNLKKW